MCQFKLQLCMDLKLGPEAGASLTGTAKSVTETKRIYMTHMTHMDIGDWHSQGNREVKCLKDF